MKSEKICLERPLRNLHGDVLQQLFTGSDVPENLVGMVRSFQKECIALGIEDKLHFKDSVVKRCEIQIGTLHLDLTTSDEEKIKSYLEANEQTEKGIAVGEKQATGHIDWQFTGVNQFGAVTICVKERCWQIEFSRLQRRISALITDETVLKPTAHQVLYEEMKKTLQPLAPSAPSKMLILQGAPGLGKSHCTEHYFYHEANKHHQMVAWLSGESEEAFLEDWEALANQLRAIDAQRSTDSDTLLIRHWCEEQLGHWLFIIDDAQVEIDWLKKHLPQKGGHVLITTSQSLYHLPKEAKILSFSPLSAEDSELLLKAWLGKYWEASGYTKEVQALSYFSEALYGSPALLTQIALLVRKKGLSFERVMMQFQSSETRNLLLADTVFDQLKGYTFLECVKKSWRQCVLALVKHYPQFTYQHHEAHLKQFIDFLRQKIAQELEEKSRVYVNEKVIIAYWQEIWASLSCAPLEEEEIISCLNLLPFTYDKANRKWAVSLAGLHALACQGSEKDLSPLPTAATISLLLKEKPDLNLPQIPLNVSLSIGLENSAVGSAEIALFTAGKSAEFTGWRLPTINPYFIPRPKLTDEIAEKLPFKHTHEKSAELVLAAASGMGGIGKTELARHFVTEPLLSSPYKRRFWFNATSATVLRNEFHEFASYLGLIKTEEYLEDKALIHRLHRWFNLNPGWLMVFDNADDYNSIAQWIPKEGGSVLITTRDPAPGNLMKEQIVNVLLLTVEEAITWLYRLAQRDLNSATEAEQKAARELVENLGCLPLAIAQSAAYLREQKTVSIEAYQQNFLELLLKDESLIERDKSIDKQSDVYSRRVIANTWKLSLKMIEADAKKKGLPNLSSLVLIACSNLAPKDIPLGLLEFWFKAFFNLKDISSQLLSYFLDEYIAQLVRYSLCERAGLTSMISMHRLVQEVLRSSLAECEALPSEIIYSGEQKDVIKKEIFISLSGALINYSGEFTPSIEDMKRRIDLISHLQTIIAAWETPNPQINSEALILLYERLAVIQCELRVDAKETLMLRKRQLDLCLKHYGPEHPKVVMLLANLGTAHGELGDAQQKKSLLEKALSILENDYGSEHPEVAIALTNLGIVYGTLGDAQQQKSMLERALHIFKYHYGPEHPQVAITLMNLGNAYGELGDDLQKKNLLEKALRFQEKYYGPKHPYVARTLSHLGNAYGALGDVQRKKRLLEMALCIMEQHYGSEHPRTAATLENLANAYGDLGDAQQRKNLLEKVLPIFEQHYGTKHPDVASTLTHLGHAYGDLGDAKQQKHLAERALHIKELYYDPEHPHIAAALANLGNAYGALGDAQQKKSLLKRALHINEHYYGSEHTKVAGILSHLSNAYGELGNIQRQKSLLERALLIFATHYGLKHLEVAVILANLGGVYGALGDAQQKKVLLERALPIFVNHYGPKHPEVARTLGNIGAVCGELGDAKQQKILAEKALSIFENHYGPKHLEVAKTLINLGSAYGALGDNQQKKNLLERALFIFENYYRPDHPHVATALMDLGNTHGALGDAKQAKIALERALLIFEQHYDSGHPKVAITLLNLSFVNLMLEFFTASLQQAQRCFHIFQSYFGEEHPYIQKAKYLIYKNSLIISVKKNLLNLSPLEQQFLSAVVTGDLSVVQPTIEKQIFSIDYRELNSQRTALHLACIFQQRDTIVYLLSKLAHFDIKDKEGKLAWEYVINTPLLELFKTTSALFSQKYSAALNAGVFWDWGKVLRMAVASDYLADVRFLIEVKGIDINSADANPKTQYTALHLAVIRNKSEIASYLVFKGADINVLDASHKTPGDYVTPEQKELLALFPITAKSVSTEEGELDLKKLRL